MANGWSDAVGTEQGLKMCKHVLVAVDGSISVHRALGEAIALASARHEHLEMLHVIDYTFLPYEIRYGNRADVVPELLNLGGYRPARRCGGGKPRR